MKDYLLWCFCWSYNLPSSGGNFYFSFHFCYDIFERSLKCHPNDDSTQNLDQYFNLTTCYCFHHSGEAVCLIFSEEHFWWNIVPDIEQNYHDDAAQLVWCYSCANSFLAKAIQMATGENGIGNLGMITYDGDPCHH